MTGELKVRVNVGGKVFETTKNTLLDGATKEHQNFFYTIMSDEWRQTNHQPDEVFIDRCPQLFAAVLHYLRYRKFRPGAFDLSDVFEEMTFYGVSVPVCSSSLLWHQERKREMVCTNQLSEEGRRQCKELAEQVALLLFDPVSCPQDGPATVFVITNVDDVLTSLPQDRPNAKVKVGLLCRSVNMVEVANTTILCDGFAVSFIQSFLRRCYNESEVQLRPVTVDFVERDATDYAVEFRSGENTPRESGDTDDSNKMFRFTLVPRQ